MTRRQPQKVEHFTIENAVELARQSDCSCDSTDHTDRCTNCIGWEDLKRRLVRLMPVTGMRG